jgi:stress-induced morphogen
MNESYMHSVPKGSETHFKVVVISSKFQGQSLLERHKAINTLLSDEFKSGLHALSIQAKTPEQWESSGHRVSESPACLGGMKKETQKKEEI